MTNTTKNLSKKAGLPPGTLVHIGRKRTDKVKISVIDYTPNQIEEKECTEISEVFEYKKSDSITWINIDGLHNIELIEQVGKEFDLHPLMLEDLVNTKHRPKMEEFANCLFISIKMLGISANKRNVVSEQVSFVVGDSWLISFQEQEGDVFDELRSRIRHGKGVVRHKSIDYLLYRLIDIIVDNYFFVTEHFSAISEKLEAEVIENPDKEVLMKIQQLKKQIINFKRSTLPLREAASSLNKNESVVQVENKPYFFDVYEHIIQLNENVEEQREVLATIMDLYLSGNSNKMNEVMKVLTIISTIFIPLTFIAGIYGMNFEIIPELKWDYGYLAVWILMIVLIIIMVILFRRKKWL